MFTRGPVMVGFGAAALVGGLWIAWSSGTPPAEQLTYHGRVGRIFQENCQTCHREGGIGPFTLETYESAYLYRERIELMVSEGRMPPWFANPTVGAWDNDRSLSEEDRADILAWVDVGAPEGDPAHAPPPVDWSAGWQLGEPDAVVQMEEPFSVPAEGVVDYQYVYVKTDFPEDRWVSKMEVRPTAPDAMHHVLVFIEPPDAKPARDAAPGEPVWMGGLRGFFAATVPGYTGNVYPEGSAKLLPKGSWLKFQLHYTPIGQVVEDQTMLGLHFADGPPERVVETGSAFNTRFEIPPGAPAHEVTGQYTFRQPGQLLTFFPHMHLRGKAFRFQLEYPDGHSQTLLDVPAYDFDWQLAYHLEEPLRVPAGALLIATGTFDNSATNRFNPDPSATVRFGEQTFEEMMIGYFDWIVDEPAEEAEQSGDGR
ncbi:MAG: cytochrome c [Longimicrobiales bacterium]